MKLILLSLLLLPIFGKQEKNKIPYNNIEYSLSLYKDISTYNSSENISLSPMSSFYTLSMILNGAVEETKEEIQKVLFLDSYSLSTINKTNRKIMESMKSNNSKFAMANSIWINEGLEVKQSFIRTLAFRYRAKVNILNFSDKYKTIEEINKWVDRSTFGKIPTIIDDIEARQKLYLINALYFYGDWKNPFDKEKTVYKDFKSNSGEVSRVEMMNQEDDFHYFENDIFQMIDLEYANTSYLMRIILPKNEIDEVVDYININNWELWSSKLAQEKVNLELPKFTINSEIDLMEPHKSLGMKLPFHYYADFSRLAKNTLFIDSFLQKTFIQVDEKGTEASSVTSLGLVTTSLVPVKRMEVNKPFIFFILEKETNNILFIGEMNKM